MVAALASALNSASSLSLAFAHSHSPALSRTRPVAQRLFTPFQDSGGSTAQRVATENESEAKAEEKKTSKRMRKKREKDESNLDRLRTSFAGPDSNAIFQRQDKNLAIADFAFLAATSSFANGIDRQICDDVRGPTWNRFELVGVRCHELRILIATLSNQNLVIIETGWPGVQMPLAVHARLIAGLLHELREGHGFV